MILLLQKKNKTRVVSIGCCMIIIAALVKTITSQETLSLETELISRSDKLVINIQPVESSENDPIGLDELKKPSPERLSWYAGKNGKIQDPKQFLYDVAVDAGLPKELLYYQWLIESSGDCKARSHKSAVGCFQFTKETAQTFGLIRKVNGRTLDLRSDLKASADTAARHLQYLGRVIYGQSVDLTIWEQLKHVLAAYNAGLSRVRRGDAPPTLPNFTETLRYVNLLQMLVEGKAIIIEEGDTIPNIAMRMHVPVEQIVRSNSEIDTRTDELIPGDIIFIPSLDGNYAEIVAKKNQTLSSIAKSAGIEMHDLKSINQIKNNRIIPGTVLKIPLETP